MMNRDRDAESEGDAFGNQNPDESLPVEDDADDGLDDRDGVESPAGAGDGSPPATPQRMSFGAFLLGVFIFVGFPAFWTAAAPVSYVRLERHGDEVRASSKTCLLFFVPYRWQCVERVIGVNDRFRAGEVTRSSHRRSTRTEDEAFLILHGEAEGDFLEVPVSPASIESRTDMAEQFLKDRAALELRLFCVSNWKFAIFAGGVISLLTVLWAVGTLLAIVRWFLRLAGL